MERFCEIYHLKNLVKEPNCFKNPNKTSCNYLFLPNCSKSLQDPQVVGTESPDFHKMFISLKTIFIGFKKDFIGTIRLLTERKLRQSWRMS